MLHTQLSQKQIKQQKNHFQTSKMWISDYFILVFKKNILVLPKSTVLTAFSFCAKNIIVLVTNCLLLSCAHGFGSTFTSIFLSQTVMNQIKKGFKHLIGCLWCFKLLIVPVIDMYTFSSFSLYIFTSCLDQPREHKVKFRKCSLFMDRVVITSDPKKQFY